MTRERTAQATISLTRIKAALLLTTSLGSRSGRVRSSIFRRCSCCTSFVSEKASEAAGCNLPSKYFAAMARSSSSDSVTFRLSSLPLMVRSAWSNSFRCVVTNGTIRDTTICTRSLCNNLSLMSPNAILTLRSISFTKVASCVILLYQEDIKSLSDRATSPSIAFDIVSEAGYR